MLLFLLLFLFEMTTLEDEEDNPQMILKFRFRFEEEGKGVYFAFTYPYSYEKSHNLAVHLCRELSSNRSIYCHRETLVQTLDLRAVDLITISSTDGMLNSAETRPDSSMLFPISSETPSNEFSPSKPVVFISARVHPGETPSFLFRSFFFSFVVTDKNSINHISTYVHAVYL